MALSRLLVLVELYVGAFLWPDRCGQVILFNGFVIHYHVLRASWNLKEAVLAATSRE